MGGVLDGEGAGEKEVDAYFEEVSKAGRVEVDVRSGGVARLLCGVSAVLSWKGEALLERYFIPSCVCLAWVVRGLDVYL